MLQSFVLKQQRWWKTTKLTPGDNKYKHIRMCWCCWLTQKVGKMYCRLRSDSFQNDLGWNLFGVGDTSNPFDDSWLPHMTLVSAPLRCISWRSLPKLVFLHSLFHYSMSFLPSYRFIGPKDAAGICCANRFAGEGGERNLHSYFIIFWTSLDLWIYIADLRSMIILVL